MSKSKNKKPSPPSSPSSASSLPPEERDLIPPGPTPEELEQADELDQVEGPPATAQLLEMAFHLWLSGLFHPIFYPMTRTFAHHRLGEIFDTKIVFNQLMLLNKGRHGALLKEIGEYRQTLFKELETMLAEGDKSR